MMPTSARPATSSYADRGSLQRLPRPRPLAHRRDEGGDGGPTDFPAGAALRPSCLTWPERRRPLPGPTDPTGLSLGWVRQEDRKSTRLNSSHRCISYAVFCLKKKNKEITH